MSKQNFREKILSMPLEEIPLQKKVASKSRGKGVQRLLVIAKEVALISKQSISFSKPILKQNNKPLIFPKTINIVQGKMGSHKSRIAEHIASTLLNDSTENKILGLEKTTSETITIVYVDTERNLTEQLPYSIQSIKQNAGFHRSEDVPLFEFTSLLEIERKERFAVLRDYLELIREKHKNHILVILDVLTDCINNFNNVEESMQFIDLLNQMINDYDITFIGVIHENPNSNDNKARGHIGTELANKATTVISISAVKNEPNFYEVRHIKSRSTERYPSYFIRYNSLTKQLEFLDELESKSLKQKKAPYLEVMNLLVDLLKNQPMSRKELLAKLTLRLGCGERTAIERLDTIHNSGDIKEIGYNLIQEDVKDKKLNQKQYRLVKIEGQENLFA